MKITTPESAKHVPFQFDGKIMLSDRHVEVIHLCLQPGESLPSHVNDFDVAIYILEGQGLVESGSNSVKNDQTPGWRLYQ